MSEEMIFVGLIAGAFFCAVRALDNGIWFIPVAAFGLAAFLPRIHDVVTGWPVWL